MIRIEFLSSYKVKKPQVTSSVEDTFGKIWCDGKRYASFHFSQRQQSVWELFD